MSYCTSCGSPIPQGQGNSCSMCYGDPYYGSDGYYLAFMEEARKKEIEQKLMEEEEYNRQIAEKDIF
jgi:hypothetical protein